MNFGEYNKQFNMILSHELCPNRRIVPFKPREKQTLIHSHNRQDNDPINSRGRNHGKEDKMMLETNNLEKENIKEEMIFFKF